MSDKDTMQALDRIGRALLRIEAIEQAAGTVPDSGALMALTERHDRLRERVRETLDRLDALIADRAEDQA